MERGKSHADELLRGEAVNKLPSPDRNLATTLVLGVLRWQIWLDRQFKALLKRPNAKLDPGDLIALRLGSFQLLLLDRIPAHAAIGESVELVKQAGHRFASGMVNAVLRGVARFQKPDMAQGGAAATQAYPAWIVQRWFDYYGAEAALAICRHGQEQPAPAVRLESPAVEDELVREGIELAPGALITCARIVMAGDVTATVAYREGRVRFQDEGSQLIAELASCAGADVHGGARNILDACAAPGGKTLILAERNAGAGILACEADAKRLAQLRLRLAPFADRVECRLADAGTLEQTGLFDLALADVPCSGTGTLGRNPEIRHRLKPDDLARHALRQLTILRAVLRAMRPGGRLVYSTCSLEPEENEQVAAAILAENSSIRQGSLEDSLDVLLWKKILTPAGAEGLRSRLTPEGALSLLPSALRTDGFFTALLEQVS